MTMPRFLKSILPLAVLTLCLSCANAQVTDSVWSTSGDTTVNVKKKKSKRESRAALASDTLPGVTDVSNSENAETSKKKKSRRASVNGDNNNALPYGDSNTPSVSTNPVVDNATQTNESNNAEPAYNTVQPNANETLADTVVTKPKKQKKQRDKSRNDSTATSEPFGQPESITTDTTAAEREREKSRSRKREEKPVVVEYIDWDTVPRRESPLTPEQKAALLLDNGNAFLTKGGYFEAIKMFDSIVAYYPNTFPFKLAYYFRANAKMGWGDEKGAEADYRFFNQLDQCKSNFCTDAHYQLALIEFRSGRYDDALLDLELVLADSTYKNHKYGYFYRGFCLAETQQYIPAIRDLLTFLTLDGQRTFASAEALYYRGFYKAKVQDNRGAIADYDKAIQLYETGMNAKTGIQHKQKLIDTYIVRALAKAEIKKYDDAIADYNIVIRLNPTSATAHRLKGLAEIGNGDLDNGCLSLSHAGELGANEAYDDIKQHCR